MTRNFNARRGVSFALSSDSPLTIPGLRIPRAAFLAGILTALTAAVLALASTQALAGDKPTKLERQINIMERAIDEMLVDSPNFLVLGRSVTEGTEVEDYGALFVFSASLTGLEWDEDFRGSFHGFWPWSKKHHVLVLGGDEGDIKVGDDNHADEIIIDDGRILITDGGIIIRGDGKGKLRLGSKGEIKTIDEKTYRERQLKKYERAKEELLDVLMEYGETLKALPAGQLVKIVANFKELDLPDGKEIHKLTVRARIDDLRSYGDGRLSDKDMRNRIEIKES